MRLLYIMIVASVCNFAFTEKAKANWTLNIGYQNPPGSSFGLNFLKFAGNWGFELGIGGFSAEFGGGDGGVDVSGGLNGKYFIGSASVKPYLQLGLHAGMSVGSNFSFAAGGLYGGLGLLFGSPKFYFYLAGITDITNMAPQLGLGFDI